VFLLQTRTFFSLQRPWIPTMVGSANLIITAVVALILYEPYGIGGIVAATSLATIMSVLVGGAVLHRALGRLELVQLIWSGTRILASAALLAAVSYFTWDVLDEALGRGLGGQIISLGVALAAGAISYGVALTLFRVPEMSQVLQLFRRREP
jgi:putative peptidoglycan lipid II flippase